MNVIYCISGLGADDRLFAHLRFPEETRIVHLPWFTPRKNESIADYAEQMASQIKDENPVMLGVSFGGMMSIEIAKIRSVKKCILISSIKTTSEKPLYFRLAASIRLNKIVPLRPYQWLEPLENYNLGVSNEEEKELARSYRKNIDLVYSNWAIDTVLHWQNNFIPPDLLHIHGTNDHILPGRYIKDAKWIEGGGHMMVMNHAEAISTLINQFLQ